MSRRTLLSLLAIAVAGAALALALVKRRTLQVPVDGAKPVSVADTGLRTAGGRPAETLPPEPWRGGSGTLEEHVRTRARALAARSWSPPPPVPEALRALGYDGYRLIRIREDRSLWPGEERFRIQLFPPGSIHDEVVRIWTVEGDSARLVGWDPTRFQVDPSLSLPEGALEAAPGYAGFRVLQPLNRADRMDEVLAFLDATYFRLLGPGQAYGLSARGIAVDPATERDEEFPAFTEFWLERPATGEDGLVVHALLDGPSLVGAYRFELRPGADGVLDVEAYLLARRDVGKLGVAPLSSMFLRAPGRGGGGAGDFRPRVHDSEGLLMWTRVGEWIWRPLQNLGGLRVTRLQDGDPRGFGLVQRERDFEAYLDLEARYDLRPSYWVEVLDGDWGSGGVELLELPTRTEFEDNVAAYWVPERPLRAGEERRFRYRLRAFGNRLEEESLGRVGRTLVANPALPGQDEPPDRRRIVVDFVGGALAALPPEAPVQPRLSLSRGAAAELVVQALPENRGRRVTFVLTPDGGHPSDMRLTLEADGTTLTETWSYVWYPDDGR